jgi:DNA-binding PadR family transcriptional regulator
MGEQRPDPRDFLPMSPLELRILLALREGCRHGYAIVKDVEERAGSRARIFPANLYRRIRNLLADGLLAETEAPPGAEPDDARQRKFFRLTPLGLAVAHAEVERLEALVAEAREHGVVPEAPTRSSR